MPSSYCHLAVHLVFSTKNRQPHLRGKAGNEMQSYIKGIIDNLGGTTLAIGGIAEHIHILCLIPSTLSVAEFLAKVKANSSKWFRAKYGPEFHWQEGYGAFSVSKSKIGDVTNYINTQREHHYHTSASDEFDVLLKKHWDPEKLSVWNDMAN